MPTALPLRLQHTRGAEYLVAGQARLGGLRVRGCPNPTLTLALTPSLTLTLALATLSPTLALVTLS